MALAEDHGWHAIDAATARNEPKDWCSKDGAQRAKDDIEKYWRERGFIPPQFKFEERGFVATLRSARVDLRSDMLNGWPRLRALPSPEQS